MNPNPYASPQAVVADVGPSVVSATARPVFFPVSRTKILLLSFCTLGLYQYYWFYMNWKIVRERSQQNISPFWRCFFGVFYCYSLFSLVRKHNPESPASELHAGPLAAFWIVFSILWKLPEPYAMVAFISIFALLPVQEAINNLNTEEAPDHDPNTRFSVWNWIVVVLGGPLFLLAIYGTFMR